MNRVLIKDLVVGQTVDTFFLVTTMTERETTGKKLFLEFIFEDGERKVNAKMWDSSIAGIGDVAVGKIVKVRAKVGEWQEKLQLTVQLCRTIEPKDKVDESDFIRKAPLDAEIMYNEIMGVVKGFANTQLSLLTETILESNKDKLLYFPGAKTVHHDIKSGLLYHMIRMLRMGQKTVEIYEDINKDLFFTGIILHDIGKVNELNSDENGVTEDYTKMGKLLGHIVDGIKIVAFTCRDLGLPEEVSLMVEHMIASHHGDESTGAIKKPMFIEAELLHMMDMIDSRAYMFNEVTNNVEEEKFSEKQFFLGNVQVYKHNI